MRIALSFLAWTKFWYAVILLVAHFGGCARLTMAEQTGIVKISQCHGSYCTDGSGTVVGRLTDGRVVVQTCGHDWTKGQPVTVYLDRGLSVQGTIDAIHFDGRDYDLGAISFRRKEVVMAFRLGDHTPAKGKEIEAAGYGRGWEACFKRTESKGPISNTQFMVDATFRQGDSGGAILHGDRVAGVIIQNTGKPFIPGAIPGPMTDGVAMRIETVREFLQQTYCELPRLKGDVPPPVDVPLKPEPDVPPPAPVIPPPASNPDELAALRTQIIALAKEVDSLKRAEKEPGPAGKNATDAQVQAAVDKWLSDNQAKWKPVDGKPADETKLKALSDRLAAIENIETPVELYKDGTLKARKLVRINRGEALRLQIESSESTRTVRE